MLGLLSFPPATQMSADSSFGSLVNSPSDAQNGPVGHARLPARGSLWLCPRKGVFGTRSEMEELYREEGMGCEEREECSCKRVMRE